MDNKSISDYQARVREEIDHYTKIYENQESLRTLTQSVPPSWKYLEIKAWELITKANEGRSAMDEVAHCVERKGGGRILSIGSGPGGQEIEIARKLKEKGVSYDFMCLDINPNLIKLGQDRANSEGLSMNFMVQDINYLELGENEFDVVMCFASLHHIINLEQVFFEINKCLKDDGELVVVDIVSRNGYLMWDETFEVVKELWKIIPEKFKFNFTSYEKPQVDTDYRNLDYGADDMECARSEDILPLLRVYFNCKVYVPYFSISRRFFDTMYGPNYDLSRPLDKAIIDLIWNLDVYYLEAGRLNPETFFGVYTKGFSEKHPISAKEQSDSYLKIEPVAQGLPLKGETLVSHNNTWFYRFSSREFWQRRMASLLSWFSRFFQK